MSGKNVVVTAGIILYLLSELILVPNVIISGGISVQSESSSLSMLIPTDDAVVDETMPNTNFGFGASLYAERRGDHAGLQVSYVKFNLSGISQNRTIVNAKFKVYIYGIVGLHYLFLGTAGHSWDEDTLNWDIKPEFSTDIGSVYLSSVDQWYSWDVTLQVQNSLSMGEISFSITPENNTGLAALYSKERGFNVPVLEIDYGDENTDNSPPIANFSWSIEELDVTFFDESLDTDGYITSWHWEFGEGNTSSQKNPYHIYVTNGLYRVTLTIQDDHGAIVSHTETLVVPPGYNLAPYANFTYSPSEPTDLEIINFTDLSTDMDGSIHLYGWDFGDGNTSTDEHPSHCYNDNGNYTVTLTVTDDHGAINSFSQVIIVENIRPIAEFTVTPDSPVNSSTLLVFVDTSTDNDGNLVNWTWDFDDGTVAHGNHTTHVYTRGGTYSVTLTVRDNDGDTDDVAQGIYVKGTVNLSITDVTFSPLNPLIGNMVTINVTLYNAGDETSDLTRINVSFDDDNYRGPPLSKDRTIGSREQKTVAFYWYTGEHTSDGTQYMAVPSGDHQINISYFPADSSIAQMVYNSGYQHVLIPLEEKESSLVIPGFDTILVGCAIVVLVLYIRIKNLANKKKKI